MNVESPLGDFLNFIKDIYYAKQNIYLIDLKKVWKTFIRHY